MVEINSSTTPQFYDHLLQNMTEGLLILDPQGVVTSATKAAATILGYEPASLIGKHYDTFWPKDFPSPDELISAEVRQFETMLEHPKGYSVPVSITANPISTEFAINKMISITGLASVQQLNEAISHTQKLAGIGTLTASVAHELNTPISIITATCGNLLHEIDDNSLSAEQLLHYVGMIEQSAWRCARIVGVLRNYTVEDALQMAVTDPNMIVEDAVTLVRHQFHGDFNVEVELDLQHNLESIVCDHNRLTQVFINLLTNARDAMQPSGGSIQIKTWKVGSASSPVNAVSANGAGHVEEFALSVTDCGYGIAPEVMDKIFDPFFTTKPNGKGTGLGLFIAKRIVTQHDGRIWVENNPDCGVTFTVVLPRKQPSVSDEQMSFVFDF